VRKENLEGLVPWLSPNNQTKIEVDCSFLSLFICLFLVLLRQGLTMQRRLPSNSRSSSLSLLSAGIIDMPHHAQLPFTFYVLYAFLFLYIFGGRGQGLGM
jgi:hypothetical protein